MLAITSKPEMRATKVIPWEHDGMQVMSMGNPVADDQPVIRRDSMLHSALRQFLLDVARSDRD